MSEILLRTETPAFAMTMSMWAIVVRDATASFGSVSDRLSILTRMRVLSLPVGREDRLWDVDFEGSRTAAMTVVWGRERYTVVSARPMPDHVRILMFIFECSVPTNLCWHQKSKRQWLSTY
jgi:hypothetical protein